MSIDRIMLIYLDGRKEITNPEMLWDDRDTLRSEFHSFDRNHHFWLTKTRKKCAIYHEQKNVILG